MYLRARASRHSRIRTLVRSSYSFSAKFGEIILSVMASTEGAAPPVVAKEKPRAAKGSKPPPSHPTYLQMVAEAISTLKERNGSSHYAIANFIDGKYKSKLPANYKKLLIGQLRKLAKSGKLTKMKGSFKLSAEAKKPLRPKPIKAPVKKPASAKPKAKPKSAAKKVVAKPKAAAKPPTKAAKIPKAPKDVPAAAKKVAAPKRAAPATKSVKKAAAPKPKSVKKTPEKVRN